MYSYQALYLLVCLGTNHQKSAQKPIRYRNIKLEFYSNYRKKICWLMKHIKINLKTKKKNFSKLN